MAKLLTTASLLQCPHGGTVSISSTNTQAKATAALVRSTDVFSIAGCPLVIATAPHPCLSVKWTVTTQRTQVKSAPLLNTDSVGLCMAADQAIQGTVLIQSTQSRVDGR
jgi:hypothetical protein